MCGGGIEMEMERFKITLEGLEIWREHKNWAKELIPPRFDMLVIDAGSMTNGLRNIISGCEYLGMHNFELNCPTVVRRGGRGYYVESADKTIHPSKIVFEYFFSREKKLTSLNMIAQINILQSKKVIAEGLKRGDHLYEMLEKMKLHKPIQNPLGLVTVNCMGASSQGVVMKLHDKINPECRISITQIDEEINLIGMYSEYERRFHRLMSFLKRKWDVIRMLYSFKLDKQPEIDFTVKEIIRFFIRVLNVLKVDGNAYTVGNEFSNLGSENVVLIPGNVITRYEDIKNINWLFKKDLINQLIEMRKGSITAIALLNNENYKHDLNRMVGGEIYGIHTQIVSFSSGLLALPLIKLPLEDLDWLLEQISDNYRKIIEGIRVEDIRYQFHQVYPQKIKELQ